MNNEMKIKFKFSWASFTCWVLQIIFLTLKLCGILTWTWAQVFIPIMVFGGIVLFDIILLVIIFIIWWRKYHNGGE